MTEQSFWFVNGKGEIVKGGTLTYEQYLAAQEDFPWMTLGMMRNYGRADAPTWGEEKSDAQEGCGRTA